MDEREVHEEVVLDTPLLRHEEREPQIHEDEDEALHMELNHEEMDEAV